VRERERGVEGKRVKERENKKEMSIFLQGISLTNPCS